MEYYESIFERFRNAAMAAHAYPGTLSHADDQYRKILKHWQDLITMSSFDLPPNAEGFDHCWLFIPVSRSNRKRKANSQITLLMVAVERVTGRLAIVTGQPTNSKLTILREHPEQIAQMLVDMHGKKNVTGFNLQVKYSYIDRFLTQQLLKSAWQVNAKTEVANTNLKLPHATRQQLRAIATRETETFLKLKAMESQKDIEFFLNLDVMDFAERFLEETGARMQDFSPIQIYNHILSAPNARSADYRMGALAVIQRTGNPFLTARIAWDLIDQGQSAFVGLAREFGVAPATVRRMTNSGPMYALKYEFPRVARFLDQLDVQWWPQSAQDMMFFHVACKTAEIFGEIFNRDPRETLKLWVREANIAKLQGWRALTQARLKSATESTLKDPSLRHTLGLKRMGNAYYSTGIAIPLDAVEDMPKFWEQVNAHYKKSLENIKDMKNDMTMRLLRPAIIHELEARGWAVTNMNALEGVAKSAHDTLFSHMAPHELIEASSYWHSPRIEFRNRFNSIAATDDQGLSWRTMLAEPTELENTVVAHPLDSAADLNIEAGAMRHCVWSYAHYCLKYNYHIFSLRDAEGTRLSTLTVQDYFENGQRLIRTLQNKAAGNEDPPREAHKAAALLVEAVKSGKLRPDWTAVDESKAAYLAREVDTAIGYDFRNPEQCARMMELYEPCLPRKISRRARGSLQTLAEIAGIPAAVTDFLATRDPQSGGVIRLPASAAAARPATPHP